MNLQSGLKLLLAAAIAACCVLPANAQSVVNVISGDVQSFNGGWTGTSSEIGQPVTFDFTYDVGAVTTKTTGTLETWSVPISSAELVGGIFGAGINLEPDGPGKGKFVGKINFKTDAVTVDAFTNLKAPTPGFTGDVYGFSFASNGPTTIVDLTRDVYSHGHFERNKSGTVDLGNISIAEVQAPEMDPTSALSALTLLMGGVAVIRGRKSMVLKSA